MALKYIISGVALAKITFAGFTELKIALENNTSVNTRPGPGSRGLGSTTAEFANSGCWCYLDGTHGKGRGKPLDEKDELCRVLHHNYECLIMEGICGDEPWNINYSTDVNGDTSFTYFALLGMAGVQATTEEQMVNACETQLSEDCHKKVCKVEMNFARQMIIKKTELVVLDTLHANGFDPLTDASCEVEAGFDSGKNCCGDYPNRFPYKTNARDGSGRQCCGSKTYNDQLFQCCADNVENLGSC
jgi:hypothetical protein